ncbi:MAG TPA: POTRA domain-containing protein, partial [Verrucomicrobiae bacterium]|nr:POTRA domain-containing protein [Verrucomicrobiae bacterium]
MMWERRRVNWPLLIFGCWICGTPLTGSATESAAPRNSSTPAAATIVPHFYVRGFTIEGGVLLSTNILTPLFSKYAGTNISLAELVQAASDLQSAYRDHGYPAMSVAFVPEQITDGIVMFNVAQTAIPQIVVAGVRFLSFSNGLEIVSQPPMAAPKPPVTAGAITTNVVPSTMTNAVPQTANFAARRATYKEMVDAMVAMHLKMDDLEMQANDTRVHVVSTNAGPRFEVEKYLVNGNTILPSAAIGRAITNIDGAFGTNVGFDDVQTVVSELGKAYHERGFVTVAVNVPQQKLTNATVNLEVREGRLAGIKVAGNRYFNSN